MTDKVIKNEQWDVQQLISKIKNNKIIKPKFQRKQKWDIHPKRPKVPNQKSYIEFLYERQNSVHAITFGQETTSDGIIFSNIDGNNRINAINHFIEKPFEIFNDYLDNLMKILDSIASDNIEKIKNIFKSLSYNDFISIKRPDKFFKSINESDLYNEIHIKQNEIDDEIEVIQNKLKISGDGNQKYNFDTNVKINVNLFVGYSTDELCKTFEDINKYNTTLTETELLACRLFNYHNFTINNNIFKTKLEESIKKYYINRADKEVLKCHEYDINKDNLNAFDFIVGFQNYCSENYKFIKEIDTSGTPLFFKLYKLLNKRYENTFTTEKVNNFINKIMYSCTILNESNLSIFSDNINARLFNKSCQKKLTSLKKNSLFMLISAIIGFRKKNIEKDIIIKKIKTVLLYHFMVKDLKKKEIQNEYKEFDKIKYCSVGGQVDREVASLLVNPDEINSKLNRNVFNDLLDKLLDETNEPYERKLENGKNRNDKRRKLRFFEKTLMFNFYKGKIPTNMLNNNFSIEHICPNSSEWTGRLNKDRTGNLIPILDSMNKIRGNNHINYYNKTDEGKEFCRFIKDIIPNDKEYDNIIIFNKKKSPFIKNNALYNEMCKKNETTYKNYFIDCLFS